MNTEQLKKVKRALLDSFPSEEELDKYLNSQFPQRDAQQINGEALQIKADKKT